jgi:hypothetical protein
MPSPFPGMDPFLESQIWDDFHQEFVGGIRQFLLPLIEPKYYARIEQRVYIDRGLSDEPRSILADVGISTSTDTRRSSTSTSSAAVAEPVIVDLVIPEEHRESFLTIVEAGTKEIVTIIEVLSPTNKRRGSDGREQYLSKRAAIINSHVNLVELDLLRGGVRLPAASPLPPADYYAFVRRAPQRYKAAVYFWNLADPLPPILIPLSPADDEARLDLGNVFDSVFDRARYQNAFDYTQPMRPPLSEEQGRWMQNILTANRA